MGAFLGALYLIAFPAFVPLDSAGLAASSLGWLLLILYFPGGLAQIVQPVRDRLIDLAARRAGLDPVALRAAHDDDQPGIPVVGSLVAVRPRVPVVAGRTVLSVQDVHKSFGGIRAVAGVSVDVQRSWTSHLVPTTVAALCLPFVRNRPLPLPHRRRFFFFFAAAFACLLALQPVSFSTSRRTVIGLSPFVWLSLKMPP